MGVKGIVFSKSFTDILNDGWNEGKIYSKRYGGDEAWKDIYGPLC